jgi:hypothetical protein
MTPRDKFGLLEYSTGVVCSGCGTKLRIEQRRSALALVTAVVALLGVCWLVGSLWEVSRNVSLVIAILLGVVVLVGSQPLARAFAQLKVREGSDVVDFPLERLKEELANVPSNKSLERSRDR